MCLGTGLVRQVAFVQTRRYDNPFLRRRIRQKLAIAFGDLYDLSDLYRMFASNRYW